MFLLNLWQARKTLRHLKGTVRLQVLTQGHTVKKQASNTLNYIHSWSRIQAQIRARRLSMVTEGRIRQKKLENQLKLEAKLHELEVRLIQLLICDNLHDQNCQYNCADNPSFFYFFFVVMEVCNSIVKAINPAKIDAAVNEIVLCMIDIK